jgi:hypothetical protein
MKSLSREQLQRMSKEELCAFFEFEPSSDPSPTFEGPATVVTRPDFGAWDI